MGMLPYDDVVIESMVAGKSVVEYSDGQFSESIRLVWEELEDLLMQDKAGLLQLL
ncbi:MAG: hypothetical protein PWQ50_2208 [Methanolobus sp.]|nr:hypothetical protein [Methanolobus sp.]